MRPSTVARGPAHYRWYRGIDLVPWSVRLSVAHISVPFRMLFPLVTVGRGRRRGGDGLL